MSLSNILSTILGGPAEAVIGYFQRRAELKAEQRKLDSAERLAIHERKVALIREGLAADASWEMEFAKQAASSWKDEYTLIVVSVPLVLCFIPGVAPYVAAGFAALSATPLWYQMLAQAMFYATVGIRFWRRQQSDT